MKNKIQIYVITFIIAAVMSLGIFAIRNGFSIEIGELDYYGGSRLLSVLSDSFFVVGVILLCISGLIFCSNHGTFSLLSYGAKNALHIIIPQPKLKHQSYYDYQQMQKEKPKKSPKIPLIIGLVFSLIGVIFFVIYYLGYN